MEEVRLMKFINFLRWWEEEDLEFTIYILHDGITTLIKAKEFVTIDKVILKMIQFQFKLITIVTMLEITNDIKKRLILRNNLIECAERIGLKSGLSKNEMDKTLFGL